MRGRLLGAYAVLICALSFVINAVGAPVNTFNDHRLMPLFMIMSGHPLYPTSETQPALSTIYPPLSVLLYAPAALFHSPRAAIITAEVCSQVFTLFPIFLALFLSRRYGSRTLMFLFFATFILWCNFSEVMRCIFLVHADPPALFLCAMTAIFLYCFLQSNRASLLVLASLCAALAPWAKQTAVPIVFCVPIVLWVAHRRRAMALYIGLFVGMEAACVAGFGKLFGLRTMLFWIITVPARHAWKSVWSTALDEANQALLREAMIPALLFATALLLAGGSFRARGAAVANALQHRLSALFGLVAVLMWPTSLLGFVKAGAGQNTLLYSAYFALAGAILLAFETLSRSDTTVAISRLSWNLTLAALGVLSVPFLLTAAKVVYHPARVLSSNTERVYEFDRENPGKVYFPWHPLAVYLAEGRVYAFELGLDDRIGAGMTIRRDAFLAQIPHGMQYVAYSGTPSIEALRLLPEFSYQVSLPELPGWIVYQRAPRR